MSDLEAALSRLEQAFSDLDGAVDATLQRQDDVGRLLEELETLRSEREGLVAQVRKLQETRAVTGEVDARLEAAIGKVEGILALDRAGG
ncbi:MAG: DUF4164 domain-containing protein [Alphaproteobacteria bacterium]|nr:DUF4164 domain-containing protein [Alphaproteobacteria bacterium]MDX5368860.1 DUF4164 domain-containing protein [Alphaproteobacteria bacterium]MDX5463585.1 DUF4164 domain-containing protein [Alphaproteobacteria bacterium]